MPQEPRSHDRFDVEFRDLVTQSNPDAYSVFTFVQQRLWQFHLPNNDAYEILNEVYIRGRQKINSGTVIHKPLAWIRVTALNVIRERSRDRNKVRDYTHQIDSISSPSSSNNYIEDDRFNLLDSFNYNALKWALSQLKETDLTILELRYGEKDLSWQEIGREIENNSERSISSVTLRQQGFRALKRLRKLFHSYHEESNVGVK